MGTQKTLVVEEIEIDEGSKEGRGSRAHGGHGSLSHRRFYFVWRRS